MQHNRRSLIAVFGALIVTLVAHDARATDVKLLKQPKTFPITISVPGSYRLKGNLTVPDANTTAIMISADNVTLDLNGFSITGPTVCDSPPPNDPLTCTPSSGTGIGIASDHNSTTILNGTIQGMGSSGISLNPGTNVRIERVRVISNGGDGIDVHNNAVITGNIVVRNGYRGISANSDSTISGNTVVENGVYGIYGWTSTVTGNTVLRNSLGIYDAEGGTVVGNTVTGSSDVGLLAGCGGFNSGYAQNTFYNNNGGNANPQVQCGVNMGQNVCGTAICP